LIETHMSRDAIERAGIFDYRRVQIQQCLSRFTIRRRAARDTMNPIRVFILTVQILNKLFIEDFETNLRRHNQ